MSDKKDYNSQWVSFIDSSRAARDGLPLDSAALGIEQEKIDKIKSKDVNIKKTLGGITGLYGKISQFLNTEQGTIDYEHGIIELIGFNPVLDTNTVISLYATPQTNDITAIRNNLLVLEKSNISMVSINA